MTVDIPSQVRDNPNLMAFVMKANNVIRREIGPRQDRTRVSWRMEFDAANRPVLKAVVSEAVTCEVPFRMQDLHDEDDEMSAKVRLGCVRLLHSDRN